MKSLRTSIGLMVFVGVIVFGIFVPFFGASVVLAGGTPPCTDPTCPPEPPGETSHPITFPNPLRDGTNNLQDFIEKVINNVVLPVGGVIAVLAIIYAGFLFVTAQGNETKLETAKRAFLYAAIGTAILLGAWVISQGIANTIGQLTIA